MINRGIWALLGVSSLTVLACGGGGSHKDNDASLDPILVPPDTTAIDGAVAGPDDASVADAADDAGDMTSDGALSDAAFSEDAEANPDDGGALGDAGDTAPGCDADNGGLTLPRGFCASVFATGLGKARHLTVSPAGDVYVAIAGAANAGPSFIALRDEDMDGKADTKVSVGSVGGNGIAWAEDRLYFASNSQVFRYDTPNGTLAPTGDPLLLVTGLPDSPDHAAKSIVYAEHHVYVNIGSTSNSCQVQNRVLESPGIDPCPELATRAGVWKFAADWPEQRQVDGLRFATGSRNLNALARSGENGHLYAAQNGRDQLFENWPKLFSADDDQRLPGEGIFELNLHSDLGWPYCYFDPQAGKNVLAPEYGGDGEQVGRCANVATPSTWLPAHWAPLGMVFYEREQFPLHYRHGAFIATHGSRFAPSASTPLPGYNVVFIPFADGKPTAGYERFAEGFAGDGVPLPEAAQHRPVGVAVGPDGALFISDDQGGQVWRVVYRGP